MLMVSGRADTSKAENKLSTDLEGNCQDNTRTDVEFVWDMDTGRAHEMSEFCSLRWFPDTPTLYCGFILAPDGPQRKQPHLRIQIKQAKGKPRGILENLKDETERTRGAVVGGGGLRREVGEKHENSHQRPCLPLLDFVKQDCPPLHFNLFEVHSTTHSVAQISLCRIMG